MTECAVGITRNGLSYSAANLAVLARVPKTAKRLLDIGCGMGALGQLIKARQESVVTGITRNEEESRAAANVIDHVVETDLNTYQFENLEPFDCIICSHVLEHLIYPLDLLRQMRAKIGMGGIIIVALPNVLFWKQRFEFLMGRFRYTRGGLMDETHLRFFDWHSSVRLLQDAGYSILERTADGSFPQPWRRLGAGFSRKIDALACSSFPGLFGWQFVIVAAAKL
jgi:SAM-dependent methyltransferase